MKLSEIKKPAFLVDKSKIIRNIEEMKLKAHNNGIIFRPHFKTHQSALIADIFKQSGIDKITVSSISMAKYFAQNGWKDITVAFPLNIREIEDIAELAKTIQLNLLISSVEQIKALNGKINSHVGFFIKIDTGYHRCGLEANQIAEIDDIISSSKLISLLKFKGFLSHFGNTYKAENKQEIQNIFENGRDRLIYLKGKYSGQTPDLIISIGDTPSCSIIDNFTGLDEIRPGNFVYYDVTQMNIGSCTSDKIAVAVACPVVDKNLKRNEIVIYGGAVHLSKDYIQEKTNRISYGSIVEIAESGWEKPIEGAYLKSISQEHGIIHAPEELISTIKIGSLIGILPVHSCLTAHLLKDCTVII